MSAQALARGRDGSKIATTGDLKFFKWLRSYQVRDSTVTSAVEAGHLAMLQYLFAMELRINISVSTRKLRTTGIRHCQTAVQ